MTVVSSTVSSTSAGTTPGGKVVLITGASSGIGEAAARRLAASGHRLFLGARRTGRVAAVAGEIEAAGGVAGHHVLDVTDRDSVAAFVEAARERYGRVDVLVNNAGIMPLSLLEALEVDAWDRMIDVNLRGVLYGIAAVLPLMREQGSGHVVNVASTSGHRVDPTAAVYSATKFAVRAVSEGLRQESRDVRVTVITPGLVSSELTGGITDRGVREAVEGLMEIAIPAAAVGEAIAYAVGQPGDVDVSEIVVRPTAQG
ncbi:SDR family oxidoreductase [Streptomyces liangshanensis]|uniref:SDR family oxidoreductase n=1 Tax=Streptomyces liangshanensis TaxID=2717324 RepID=A0A6G9H7X0_9ACTN|nr:SDR family oxidoreductase [Streptomyces liangshanensis]QIQ06311.1 SDR family oxidoreductase [Streptomyces liangshanensis]